MQEAITEPAIWQRAERHLLRRRYPDIKTLNGLLYDAFEIPLNGNSANCVTKFFNAATDNPLFYLIPLSNGVAFYHQSKGEDTMHTVQYMPTKLLNGDSTLICIEEKAPVIDEDMRATTLYGLSQQLATRIKVPGTCSMGYVNNSAEKNGIVLFSHASLLRVEFDRTDSNGFRAAISPVVEYYESLFGTADISKLLNAPPQTHGNLTFRFALPQETFVRNI